MATFGSIPSSFGNVLFDPMAVDAAVSKMQTQRLYREDLQSQIDERDANRAWQQQTDDYGGPAGGTTQQGASAPVGSFEQQLGGAEGGTNPAAVNKAGYSGQFQFGAARLADLGVYQPAPGEDLSKNEWKGTFSIPAFAAKTHDDFLKSPAAQHAVFGQHVGDIDKTIAATPGAAKLDQNGLRAVAHLGGNAGMQRFVETGGVYDPADSNGTRLSDYYRKFAEGGAPALQAAFGSPHGPGGPQQQADTGPQMPGGVAARTGGVDVAGPGAPPAPAAVAPAPQATPLQATTTATSSAVPPPTPPPPTNERGLTNNDRATLDQMRHSKGVTPATLAAAETQMRSHNQALAAQHRNELQQYQQTERQTANDAAARTQQALTNKNTAEEMELRRKSDERAAKAAENAGLPTGYEHDPDNAGWLRFKPGGPADPKVIAANKKAAGEGRGERPLHQSERAKLVETSGKIDAVGQSITDFRDDYGGFAVAALGDFYNTIARNTPGESPRADWWQNYQRYKIQVRQGISGQTLTATEKSEFDKADISPAMSPETIRSNLTHQQKILSTAQRKLVKSLAADNYNTRALQEASGVDPDEPDAPPASAPAASGGWTVKRIN